MKRVTWMAGAAVVAIVTVVWAVHRPIGTEDTNYTPENGCVVFKDANFASDSNTIPNVTEKTKAAAHVIPGENDTMTSLKWNLPEGVIVVFYKDGDAKSRQYMVFGKGQDPDLSDNDFQDMASSWVWYRVGPEARTVHVEVED